MLDNNELKAIEQFADRLRKHLPITQDEDTFEHRIKKIMFQYFHDIISIEEQKCRLEFDIYANDIAKQNE